MSRKKRKAPKGDVVWRQTAEEATLAGKPRYNGFACGHGAHGDAKYNRAKAKRRWQAQMKQEGASRGSFLYMGLSSQAHARTWRREGCAKGMGCLSPSSCASGLSAPQIPPSAYPYLAIMR